MAESNEDGRPPSVWAMVGLVVAILGWLTTQAGFPPADGEPALEIGESARASLRSVGVVLLFSGASVAAWARLRVPLGVFVAGAALNIAAEAGTVTPHSLGLVGLLGALTGSLWASRQVREGLEK